MDTVNYLKIEDVKREYELKKLEELIIKYRLCPVAAESTEKSILVVDINYLPSEFKGKPLEYIREQLEQMYSCKVLLLDASRQNIQGSSQILPAYFI